MTLAEGDVLVEEQSRRVHDAHAYHALVCNLGDRSRATDTNRKLPSRCSIRDVMNHSANTRFVHEIPPKNVSPGEPFTVATELLLS